MYSPATSAETLVERALSAFQQADRPLFDVLDQLPAAIYVTDAEGLVTYFNPACIDFTGRRPEAGRDRWCVTWKLYTSAGAFLPHDQCPMAVSIHTRQPIRGVTAVAERPDGTRVNFRPYPTPIFDEHGGFVGAVNVLIDVTDEAEELLAQARRCRRLAFAVDDRQAASTLERLAEEYETRAQAVTPRAGSARA